MKIITNADLPKVFNHFTTKSRPDGRVWVAVDSFGSRIVQATQPPMIVRADDESFEIREFSDFEGYLPETITFIEFESAVSKSRLQFTRIDKHTGWLDYLAGRPGYRSYYYRAYAAATLEDCEWDGRRVFPTVGCPVDGRGPMCGLFRSGMDAIDEQADDLAVAIVALADLTPGQAEIARRNSERLPD